MATPDQQPATEPERVVWSHDGFTANVSQLDDAAGDRRTVVVIAITGPVGAMMLGWLAMAVTNELGVAAFLAFVGLAVGSFVGGVLTVRSKAVQQALMRREVGVDGTRVWWDGAGARAVPLGEVTGLRVAGPRPWRLVVECEEESHRVDCGNERDARWLAEAIATQVRRHLSKGGSDEVPRRIQRLTER